MTTHRLKTWPEMFVEVRAGRKSFEMRWDDRAYEVGDILELAEYDPVKGWTGEVEFRRVTFAMRDERFGVSAGYVAMGMERVQAAAAPAPTPSDMTLADVEAWHASEARRAFQRADTYHHAPFARMHACGDAAAADAAFHARSALLIKGAGGSHG